MYKKINTQQELRNIVSNNGVTKALVVLKDGTIYDAILDKRVYTNDFDGIFIYSNLNVDKSWGGLKDGLYGFTGANWTSDDVPLEDRDDELDILVIDTIFNASNYTRTITIDEIAKKFNIPVSQLHIKK